ncbi:MAG TPA: hypothetical protein VK206_23375 [Anaerolineales bacterium]|nr:hypothetical protein [Anaerolineales bacterium]
MIVTMIESGLPFFHGIHDDFRLDELEWMNTNFDDDISSVTGYTSTIRVNSDSIFEAYLPA